VAVAVALALQVPVAPAPSSERSSTRFFQDHAQWATEHPMADVTLASYLSSPLPYDTPEEQPPWR
jgi:hypothetical protein